MKKIVAAILCFCLLMGTCALGASAADKVYALTMGVHKYSANNTVSDGSDIATVTYTRQKDGSTGSASRLFDIEKDEVFTITTAVREGQENHYAFVGWLDVNGALIGTDTTIVLTMDGSKAVFAAYAENANRYVVSYGYTGTGKVSASSNRVTYQGVDCISVLHGADVTFKFTPSKDFYAVRLVVNGAKVSMLAYSVDTLIAAVSAGKIGDAFKAIVNYVKFLNGKEATFVVRNVTDDLDFQVKFMRPYFS